MTDTDRSRNPIEFRAATVADVAFPKRTIELVVMPYESETVVEYQRRMIREVIARGAFNGIECRDGQVRLNRDHDKSRTFGKVERFHPERDEGLVAECRIAQTPLGDDTLALAAEGMLDASAGFAPIDQVWDAGRSLRRITRAFLDHIAMTPDPAYPDARVLAVRNLPEAPVRPPGRLETPNLDQIRLWRLEAEYDRIGR